MINYFLLTFFLFFSSLVAIYPSKKENNNLIDYCHSFEKILSRNSLEKNKNVSQKYNNFVKDISLYGTNKTKGALVNKIINQYKNSKKSKIINFFPNKFYCLTGYWIEYVNPGTISVLLYEKTHESINRYKDAKQEVDEFIRDINFEYKSIKKRINDFF